MYVDGGKVYRAIKEQSAPTYLAAREIGLYNRRAEKELLLPAREIAVPIAVPKYTLEHPRIPFLSYPTSRR